jgi:hypothetical protein
VTIAEQAGNRFHVAIDFSNDLIPTLASDALSARHA